MEVKTVKPTGVGDNSCSEPNEKAGWTETYDNNSGFMDDNHRDGNGSANNNTAVGINERTNDMAKE